jgi:hypothetical protein
VHSTCLATVAPLPDDGLIKFESNVQFKQKNRKFKNRLEVSGEVVKDTTFRVSKKESIYPVLKVPRQCPLVLLVEAAHIFGIKFF